ncbi:hypothetical protein [Paenisporosarcina quisquiliarum]|uniref:hypothetical protein n=1 Tax=Paenisporosarcina quisquiliarum TaxID=365346 RepID=UPI003736B54E
MNLWKYKYKNEYRPLEQWMLFAIAIGRFSHQNSLNEKPIHIYMSLPNNLIFSYFVALGISDENLKKEIGTEAILTHFQKLKSGDYIYYYHVDKWVRCSVIELVKGATSTDSWHLKILNLQKTTHLVPQKQWRDRVIIVGKGSKDIKSAKSIKELNRISMTILQYIYDSSTLQTHELINEPCINLVGTRTEFNDNLHIIEFDISGHILTMKDFLMDGSMSDFLNIHWVTKSAKEDASEGGNLPTIFVGANKALAHLKNYKNNCRIILDDRHENSETSDLLRTTIVQEIVNNQSVIVTSQISNYLNDTNITIPKGVELLGWQ